MAEDDARKTSIPPYPLAMVVCDAIWRDPGTGKHTLLGLFSGIQAKEFPAKHGLLALFVALTDGHGKTRIGLRLVDAEEKRKPLFDGSQEVDFVDPRAIVEISFHVSNLLFEEPAEYRFQLFGGGELLMERRILVGDITEKLK